MNPLFRYGNFTLASGATSSWKIDCDALTPEDWDALAAMAASILPPFGYVEGVPTGGIPFAKALGKYVNPDSLTLLIAEDVLTTGGSMERFRNGLIEGTCDPPTIGIVVFARGRCPNWVTPLFQMPEGLWIKRG
jgi:orotate phosphoribosyltransferase